MKTIKLYVDAWTSGNPGIGGCRVVDSSNTICEWSSKTPRSNNFFETAAIGLAIKWIYDNNTADTKYEIYSDSVTAIAWISKIPALPKCIDPEITHELLRRIHLMLTELKNVGVPVAIIKWDTATNGEIPADYGRK